MFRVCYECISPAPLIVDRVKPKNTATQSSYLRLQLQPTFGSAVHQVAF